MAKIREFWNQNKYGFMCLLICLAITIMTVKCYRLLCIAFTSGNKVATVDAEETTEFTPMLQQVYKAPASSLYILTDDQNVMYLLYDLCADSGASCMMVNADGSPRIWDADNEDKLPIEVIEEQQRYNIYRDTKTNVLYLYAKQMTVMRNADGSIKLYDAK